MPNNSYTRRVLLDTPGTERQAIRAANLTWLPSDHDNLPFDSPHTPQQLLWASPPVDDQYLSVYGTQNNFSPIGTVTMGVKKNGATITLGTFPSAQRVASTTFIANCGLLSVDLALAIDNDSADGEVGAYVAKDTGPVISLALSADIYDGVLAPFGQFSKRSGVSFGIDIAPLIKVGTAVGIYVVAYGANLATSNITITATLRYVSLDA